jgi:predicted O-linked N-acetylglucosamine transferase (SPINDLY family)
MTTNSYQDALNHFKNGSYENAEQALLDCLSKKQFTCEIFGLLGYVYGNQGRYHEAVFYLNKALNIDSKNAEIIYNLVLAQYCMGMYQEGINNLQYLKSIVGESFEVYVKLAEGYEKMGELSSAIQYYKKSIKLTQTKDIYIYKVINLLITLKKYREAIILYSEVKPGNGVPATVTGEKFYLEMMICDWKNYQKIECELNSEDWIEKFTPNHLLSLPVSASKQKQLTEFYVNKNYPHTNISLNERNNKKIRIGYFSSDFHNHATAYLLAEFFELHDKNKFEIYAISFGPDLNDLYRNRLKNSFDQFYQISNMGNDESIKFCRELMLDIAVDLKGHGKNSGIFLFSERVAPIQINYLVYPGTIGGNFIDYIIADNILIPEEYENNFTEKIIRMKSSYQVSDRSRIVSNNVISKEAWGLPKNSFVFACFNNNYKITPDVFGIWMKVLLKIPNSVLWLLEDNGEAKKNLIKEARKCGVHANRIRFASRVSTPDHLARHAHVDLFLDTFYYNAHTTANDALWMGVPIITLCGKTFASRVCASLLSDLGLEELITYTALDYEQKIIEIASNGNLLKKIKERLANKSQGKLFDIPEKVKDFEEIMVNLVSTHRVNPISFNHKLC